MLIPYIQVFISGPYPYWIFLTSKGVLRAHPMPIDGTVTCFAPFNNVNCPKGFLYFNKQVSIFIYSLYKIELAFNSIIFFSLTILHCWIVWGSEVKILTGDQQILDYRFKSIEKQMCCAPEQGTSFHRASTGVL